jgi:hypothetical protein
MPSFPLPFSTAAPPLPIKTFMFYGEFPQLHTTYTPLPPPPPPVALYPVPLALPAPLPPPPVALYPVPSALPASLPPPPIAYIVKLFRFTVKLYIELDTPIDKLLINADLLLALNILLFNVYL